MCVVSSAHLHLPFTHCCCCSCTYRVEFSIRWIEFPICFGRNCSLLCLVTRPPLSDDTSQRCRTFCLFLSSQRLQLVHLAKRKRSGRVLAAVAFYLINSQLASIGSFLSSSQDYPFVTIGPTLFPSYLATKVHSDSL